MSHIFFIKKYQQLHFDWRSFLLFILCIIAVTICQMPASFAQSSLWSPPAIANFNYQLSGQWRGNISGHGSFDWTYSPQNKEYAMSVNISAFFMSFLYTSKGVYDINTGILPTTYREKRIGRDRTVSFNYPNQTLSFNWKDKNDTREFKEGTQDAISVLMQIIHQMTHGVKELRAGEKLTFPIARMGSVKEWSFSVIGYKKVQVRSALYDAWHVKWISPKGESNTLVEMWLAPSLSYMPVKLFYWSEDGTSLDIIISKINAFEK